MSVEKMVKAELLHFHSTGRLQHILARDKVNGALFGGGLYRVLMSPV
jgi:hypothetical protein